MFITIYTEYVNEKLEINFQNIYIIEGIKMDFKKRILSIFTAVALVVTMGSISVFALENNAAAQVKIIDQNGIVAKDLTVTIGGVSAPETATDGVYATADNTLTSGTALPVVINASTGSNAGQGMNDFTNFILPANPMTGDIIPGAASDNNTVITLTRKFDWSIIVDDNAGGKINDATVDIICTNDSSKSQTITNGINGKYKATLLWGDTYTYKVSKTDYADRLGDIGVIGDATSNASTSLDIAKYTSATVATTQFTNTSAIQVGTFGYVTLGQAIGSLNAITTFKLDDTAHGLDDALRVSSWTTSQNTTTTLVAGDYILTASIIVPIVANKYENSISVNLADVTYKLTISAGTATNSQLTVALADAADAAIPSTGKTNVLFNITAASPTVIPSTARLSLNADGSGSIPIVGGQASLDIPANTTTNNSMPLNIYVSSNGTDWADKGTLVTVEGRQAVGGSTHTATGITGTEASTIISDAKNFFDGIGFDPSSLTFVQTNTPLLNGNTKTVAGTDYIFTAFNPSAKPGYVSAAATLIYTYSVPAASLTTSVTSTESAPQQDSSSTTSTTTVETTAQPQIVVVEVPYGLEDANLIKAEAEDDTFDQPVELRLKNDPKAKAEVEAAIMQQIPGINVDSVIFPLDIGIYIKGTETKVQPNNGNMVIVTCPIPAELLASKDKIVIVCVIDGVLTVLPTELLEKNGVWCVVFKASHFSPYAFVVDTDDKLSNLAAGAGNEDNAIPLPKDDMPYAIIAVVLTYGIIMVMRRKEIR